MHALSRNLDIMAERMRVKFKDIRMIRVSSCKISKYSLSPQRL